MRPARYDGLPHRCVEQIPEARPRLSGALGRDASLEKVSSGAIVEVNRPTTGTGWTAAPFVSNSVTLIIVRVEDDHHKVVALWTIFHSARSELLVGQAAKFGQR